MPDTDTKPARRTWTHVDALALARAYESGGVSAAHKAFPNRPHEDVEAKLRALGLLALPATDAATIGAFIEEVRVSDHPALMTREAIRALNALKRDKDGTP